MRIIAYIQKGVVSQPLTDCRKTSCLFKNGVAGAKPPTGTRGGSPSNIAPARMPGVYAQRLCKDAKPTKRS